MSYLRRLLCAFSCVFLLGRVPFRRRRRTRRTDRPHQPADGCHERYREQAGTLRRAARRGRLRRSLHRLRAALEYLPRIRYDARLVRTDDKRVVASRRFEVSQPVDGKKVAAVVSAFGKAGDTLSAQVLDWTLRQASAQPAVQP